MKSPGPRTILRLVRNIVDNVLKFEQTNVDPNWIVPQAKKNELEKDIKLRPF